VQLKYLITNYQNTVPELCGVQKFPGHSNQTVTKIDSLYNWQNYYKNNFETAARLTEDGQALVIDHLKHTRIAELSLSNFGQPE